MSVAAQNACHIGYGNRSHEGLSTAAKTIGDLLSQPEGAEGDDHERLVRKFILSVTYFAPELRPHLFYPAASGCLVTNCFRNRLVHRFRT